MSKLERLFRRCRTRGRVPNGLISPLIVEVYPHGNGDYTLYEDEGETRFSYRENGQSFRFEWNSSVEREMILHFRQFGRSLNAEEDVIHLLSDGTLEVRIARGKQGAIDSRYESR